MRKKYKFIIIAALAAIAALCLFAGCKLNTTLEDVLGQYNLTARMTYFLNNGTFEDNGKVKHMYFTAGSLPYKMSTQRPSSGSAQVNERTGFEFDGWFEVDTNEDGLPLYTDGTVFNEEVGFERVNGENSPYKTISTTDVPYDFTKALQAGDHTFACAKWHELSKIDIHLIADGFDTLTVSRGEDNVETYKEGDVLSTLYFTRGEQPYPGSAWFNAEGFTFVKFYEDAAGTTPFDGWPVQVPEEIETIDIYARFIEGDWVVVENTNGVSSMFRNGSGEYFVVNDIDCTGLEVNNFNAFRGKICGDTFGGVTERKISNLSVRQSGTTLSMGSSASLFGNINASAEFKNVNFDNVKINFSVRSEASSSVFLFCNSIASGATFENFTISADMTVTLGSEGSILEEFGAAHWVFGGFVSDSDYAPSFAITAMCTVKVGETTTGSYSYPNNQ